MQKILQFFILFSISILYIKGDDSDYCYAKDNSPYKLFSEWTSYDDVKGETVIKKGCTPIYVWGLVKGVGKLTDKQIKRSEQLVQLITDIEQNNKDKRCALCSEDYQNINSVNTFWDVVSLNEDLAKKAIRNHESFASYLGNFIDSTQKLTKDDFETINTFRAHQSAVRFANKLLGTNFQDLEGPIITANETLLRSKDDCAKWTASYKERDDFDSTTHFKAMFYRISNRLGFSSLLSFDIILAMLESCMIENALTTSSRPAFCAAFLPEDLKVLEYRQDLKHYYEYGYGNSLSPKMGCPLLKDMVDKLSKASAGTLNGKKGVFYFADDASLMGMITKLGLYRDQEALKHDNYQYQKGNREWRSSLLSPYTATIHAVLFNCANNEKKIEFYHNQNIIKLEGCKTSTSNTCPLDTFLTDVKKSLTEDKCDEDFCGSFPGYEPQGSGGNMLGFSFIVMVVCFLFSRL